MDNLDKKFLIIIILSAFILAGTLYLRANNNEENLSLCLNYSCDDGETWSNRDCDYDCSNETGAINLTEHNLSEEDLFLDFGTANFDVSGNISANWGNFISWGSRMDYEIIKGNFTTKTITIGIEKVPGILEEAIQIVSYEGDYFKHPEFKLSTGITTAEFIASERFLNQSECSRLFLGVRAKSVIIKRKFWFDSERIEFYDEVAYICTQTLDEVWYYPERNSSDSGRNSEDKRNE